MAELLWKEFGISGKATYAFTPVPEIHPENTLPQIQNNVFVRLFIKTIFINIKILGTTFMLTH